jgi:hypothetical protein
MEACGSVDEVLALRAEVSRGAEQAGRDAGDGTDLGVPIAKKRQAPRHLIDVGGIVGLAGIVERPCPRGRPRRRPGHWRDHH